MRLLTSCLIHKIAQTNHDLREGCFDLGDLCEAKRMKLTVFLNGQFLSPRNDHSVFRNVPQSIEFFKVIPECVIKLRWMRREIGEPFGKEVAHFAKVLFCSRPMFSQRVARSRSIELAIMFILPQKVEASLSCVSINCILLPPTSSRKIFLGALNCRVRAGAHSISHHSAASPQVLCVCGTRLSLRHG